MRKIQALIDSFRFHKAGVLTNAGRYSEALDILGKIEASSELIARRTLYEGDVYHRMKDYPSAVARYRTFIDEKFKEVLPEQDERYLLSYAKYYLACVERKLGHAVDVSGLKSDMERAARTATRVTTADFPP
ncbi:MAG: hypothetical protein KDE03_02370 [Rhodobacteraceae bacterium]|nr:hypothetical protein [Paracoccaceae bacterium]